MFTPDTPEDPVVSAYREMREKFAEVCRRKNDAWAAWQLWRSSGNVAAETWALNEYRKICGEYLAVEVEYLSARMAYANLYPAS